MKVLAEHFEVAVEIGYIFVVGMFVIDTETSSYIDAADGVAAAFEELGKLVHTVTEGHEVYHIHYLRTDMTWRDMQVAWRTMSLLHGLFMLQDAPFTDNGSIVEVFTDLSVWLGIKRIIDRINSNAIAA